MEISSSIGGFYRSISDTATSVGSKQGKDRYWQMGPKHCNIGTVFLGLYLRWDKFGDKKLRFWIKVQVCHQFNWCTWNISPLQAVMVR